MKILEEKSKEEKEYKHIFWKQEEAFLVKWLPT